MGNLTVRCLTTAAMLLIASAFSGFINYSSFYKSEEGLQAISHIPERLGRWQGKDLPLDKQVYDILETKSIIHRNYISGMNLSVFLSVVYYTETKVDFHAPEACLGSSGVEIQKVPKVVNLKSGDQTIRLKVNQLIQRNGSENTLVYYFYKTGDFMGRSYILLRLNMAINKFGHGSRSGSLVRVSTPIGEKGPEQAARTLSEYLSDLYPYVEKYL